MTATNTNSISKKKKKPRIGKPPVDNMLIDGLSEMTLDTKQGSSVGRHEKIALGEIKLNPNNARQSNKCTPEEIQMHLDKKVDLFAERKPKANFFRAITELASSIEDTGLIEPIVVIDQEGKYLVLAGERRYLAHVYLQKTSIDTVIRPVSSKKESKVLRLEEQLFALAENTQREDLSIPDLLMSIEKTCELYEEIHNKPVTPTILEGIIHKSKSRCSRYLTIIRGDNEVYDMVVKTEEITSIDKAWKFNSLKSSKGEESLQNALELHRNPAKIKAPSPVLQKEEKEPAKKEPVKPGRKVVLVKMGNTKNLKLIKSIVLSLTQEKSWYSDTDWTDAVSVQSAWGEFIKEQEIIK